MGNLQLGSLFISQKNSVRQYNLTVPVQASVPRRCTASVDSGLISSRLLQAPVHSRLLFSLLVVWHPAIYETLTSSSNGTRFKRLQSQGTTVLLSPSEQDNEWEGEEGKRQSGYHQPSHTCLLYEIPPSAVEEVRDVIRFCGWIRASEATQCPTDSAHALTNSEDEMENLIFEMKSKLLKLCGVSQHTRTRT